MMYNRDVNGVRCCKNCEKRYENCHSKCPIYAREKLEYDKKMAWLKSKNSDTAIPRNAYEKHVVSLLENPRRRLRKPKKR